MNALSKFGKHVAITAVIFMAFNFSSKAQNPVESTHIDEDYANTTVVYKNSDATDTQVLASLENGFGIGDVIRVTIAPPPAPIVAISAPNPVHADKSKGEDTWLPKAAKPSAKTLAASSSSVTVVPKNGAKNGVTPPKPAIAAPKPILQKTLAPAKAVVADVPNQVKALEPAPIQEQKELVAGAVSKAKTATKAKTSASAKKAKAHKSAKKSGKRAGYKMKKKNRKPGKQRYACPKF